jgi:hypothetical protein
MFSSALIALSCALKANDLPKKEDNITVKNNNTIKLAE